MMKYLRFGDGCFPSVVKARPAASLPDRPAPEAETQKRCAKLERT
jgi:hypothetical protein